MLNSGIFDYRTNRSNSAFSSSSRKHIGTRDRARRRSGFSALIFACTGETGRAISEIERLLTTPFAVDYADDSITLSDLLTRWEWDPLRTDPRIQKILAGPEPKTTH
jgi:hypothetical protein